MTTSDGAIVVGGVDCHSRAHHAVALDQTGRRLGDRAFPATSAGYADLLGWLRGFGAVAVVGVESTGSYGAALTRLLVGPGCGSWRSTSRIPISGVGAARPTRWTPKRPLARCCPARRQRSPGT